MRTAREFDTFTTMKVAKGCTKSKSRTARAKALKISAMTRYALRILADIALHADDGEPRTEKAIAERQEISMKFLSRIVIPLRSAKIIAAKQGSRDGFALRKSPSEITMLEIVETMQGPVAVLDCLVRSAPCGRSTKCLARRVWCRVNDALVESLRSITLADALDGMKQP